MLFYVADTHTYILLLLLSNTQHHTLLTCTHIHTGNEVDQELDRNANKKGEERMYSVVKELH